MGYSQHKKPIPAVADTIVGYSVIAVNAAAVKDLTDGVDYAGGAVAIPTTATGAIITVEDMSEGCVLWITDTVGIPNPTTRKGITISEALTSSARILLGRVEGHIGIFSELTNFKAICATGGSCRLEVTYVIEAP